MTFTARHIEIEWDLGRGDAADEARAEAAASAVFEAAGVDPVEAECEYARQWIDLDDEAGMTGLALTYVKARSAANIAATEGWHSPEGGYVSINCGGRP